VLTRRQCLLGAVASAALLQRPADATNASAVIWDAADVHVDGYPTVTAVRWIGDTLERESEGRIRLRQFHSGQLGREADTMSLVRYGALALTRVTVASVNNPFPITQVLSLPFVFDDVAHLRRSLDGPAGQQILETFSQRGMIGLCFYDGGVRSVYNTRRPVLEPADLKGLKLRVPPSDIFMELMRAYGVNATPLPYGEVYSALQTHLIDGAENNWPSFHSSRQFEVARYWSQTEHSQVPEVLLLSAQAYNALRPSDRELVRDVARRSVPLMRQWWDERVEQARSAAIVGGVLVNEVDSAAFRVAATPLVERYLARDEVRELYRQIRAESGLT
jgi:tripartite ATP-independent transporter DctP family solute receptor